MNKEIIKNFAFIIYLVILSSMILAQSAQTLDNEDFQKKLEEFKQNGDLRVFSDNFNFLIDQQKSEIIDSINNNRQKFWNNWKSLDAKTKTTFTGLLNSEDREKFNQEFSKYYGISFKGFDKNTGFGVRGVIGNPKVYLDAEKIKAYNQRTNDKIKFVEYKGDEDKDILKITKESGDSAEIIVGKDNNGFYFDPNTNKFTRIIKSEDGKYSVDTKDLFSGQWNGKGHLTLDFSEDDIMISAERNNKKSDESSATFKTSDGNEYSALKKPIKNNEGKSSGYEYPKAEITFDKNGKLKELHNVYVKGSKFNGLFGANTNVFHSKNDYDSLSLEAKDNLGAYLIIDEEKGFVGGDVAREKLSVAQTSESLRKWVESYKDNFNNILDAAKRLSDEDFIEAYAEGAGLSKDNPLLRENPDDMRRILEGSLRFGRDSTAVAESIASAVHKETALPIYNKPLEGSFLDLQLKNNFAKNLKNIDLRGGSLSIEDNSGKMINVVREATPYNYILNADFNKKNPSFSGINFNLINRNIPEHKVQIYSDGYGGLNAKGIGTTTLQTIGGRTYSVAGNVNVQGRLFGIVNINNPFYDRLFSMQYKVSPETLKEAQDYLYRSEDSKDYLKLYNSYKQGGFTQAEIKELRKKAGDITIKYNNILGKGDSSFSIDFLSRQQPRKFSQALYDLSGTLIKASKTKTSTTQLSDDLLQTAFSVSTDRIFSDPKLRDALIQRGYTNQKAFINAGKKQIEDIGYFLRDNYYAGNSFTFVEDSKNNLYQIKIGSKTMNLDPALGSLTSEVLPLIVGQGGVDAQGNFYVNPNAWGRNRLIGNKEVTSTVYRGYSLRGAMQAGGKSGITKSVQNELEKKVPNAIKTPR